MTPSASIYSTLYRGDYMRSGWLDRAANIVPMLRREWDILEVGAGRGDLGEHMRALGWRWTTCDETPAGPNVITAALPHLGVSFPYRRFDCSVSIDVLEHLPPADITAALRDLQWIAPRGVWAVANMSDPHDVDGQTVDLHLTQQPPEWWIARITKLGGTAVAHTINCHRFWLEVTW